MDLGKALARARTDEVPGPDMPAAPMVPDWPGPARRLPRAELGQLDLRELLRLSLAAADGTGRLRPAPSAGALHPVDAQLVVGDNCAMEQGRYGYDPLCHRVHRLGAAPGDVLPGVAVELYAIPQRTEAHYGHRAWPLILLDAGHAAAALWLAGRALGAGAPALDLEGAGEQPLAVVHFAPDWGGRRRGEHGLRQGEGAGRMADRNPHQAPEPRDLLARRSTPPPLNGTLTRADLLAVLTTAQQADAGELSWCVAVGAPEPELVELAPDGALRRLAAGEARPTLAAWAAGQRWIADAGAVLIGYGCPSDADAERIRRTHLRAGFAVGRAHVAALQRGLASRPVGSWQQADLGAALGRAPEQDWIVHGLALGRPEEGT
ncbi:SagB/ThcOx family dehydrogenase [Streptomyces sp. YC504]|uniref:SagB/ThcOx family dehydrogenase n=1 Tax=Streptomyces mesophilus TaxID=1775132 RepID=A0A6G4XB33_9ACTN|nr:SagB/ThcOx family dehydrogenase [Streptomyces mesophilus]NGO74598.1 SagB/ThcOx family dehydrogenase [Streptomyces mesophilus]